MRHHTSAQAPAAPTPWPPRCSAQSPPASAMKWQWSANGWRDYGGQAGRGDWQRHDSNRGRSRPRGGGGGYSGWTDWSYRGKSSSGGNSGGGAANDRKGRESDERAGGWQSPQTQRQPRGPIGPTDELGSALRKAQRTANRRTEVAQRAEERQQAMVSEIEKLQSKLADLRKDTEAKNAANREAHEEVERLENEIEERGGSGDQSQSQPQAPAAVAVPCTQRTVVASAQLQEIIGDLSKYDFAVPAVKNAISALLDALAVAGGGGISCSPTAPDSSEEMATDGQIEVWRSVQGKRQRLGEGQEG